MLSEHQKFQLNYKLGKFFDKIMCRAKCSFMSRKGWSHASPNSVRIYPSKWNVIIIEDDYMRIKVKQKREVEYVRRGEKRRKIIDEERVCWHGEIEYIRDFPKWVHCCRQLMRRHDPIVAPLVGSRRDAEGNLTHLLVRGNLVPPLNEINYRDLRFDFARICGLSPRDQPPWKHYKKLSQ